MRIWLNGRRWRVAVLVVCAGAVASACGGSTAAQTGGGDNSNMEGSGTASVAYAASLTSLNEKTVGPAFASATGDHYTGRAGPSLGLSQEISSGEISPNVFESIGSKPIEALEPRFTKWYIQFAASPIVVAYNPASKYASQFKAIADGSKPLSDLFTLMAQPGFKVGRTDPNVDPQGQAFIVMLMLAQEQYHLPASIVTKIIHGNPSSADSPTVFDEAALEPRLQAGQLDAASAYRSQAVQLHLPYIPLPASIDLGDPALASHYASVSFKLADGETEMGKPLVADITTIGKNDPPALAFVRYVLSAQGRALHKQGGYTLLKPTAFGDTAAIPATVRAELGSG